MAYKNGFYLLYGFFMGIITGILISDEKKKKWYKKVQSQAKSLLDRPQEGACTASEIE